MQACMPVSVANEHSLIHMQTRKRTHTLATKTHCMNERAAKALLAVGEDDDWLFGQSWGVPCCDEGKDHLFRAASQLNVLLPHPTSPPQSGLMKYQQRSGRPSESSTQLSPSLPYLSHRGGQSLVNVPVLRTSSVTRPFVPQLWPNDAFLAILGHRIRSILEDTLNPQILCLNSRQ